MLTMFCYYSSMVDKAPIIKMVVFHWFYKQNNPRQRSGKASAKLRRSPSDRQNSGFSFVLQTKQPPAKIWRSPGKAPAIVEIINFHWFYKQNNFRQSSSKAPAIVKMVVFHWFYKQNDLRRKSSEAPAIVEMIDFH